jgi:hypothetical protein
MNWKFDVVVLVLNEGHGFWCASDGQPNDCPSPADFFERDFHHVTTRP